MLTKFHNLSYSKSRFFKTVFDSFKRAHVNANVFECVNINSSLNVYKLLYLMHMVVWMKFPLLFMV